MRDTTAARELCAEAGVIDPPALLVLAIEGMKAGDARDLVAEMTPELLRRLRLGETSEGQLSRLLGDIVSEEADDFWRNRIRRKAREEL